ncbi:MAG: glycosyltransferase family 2 protein, partial [Flavobacteriaceae bacterium]
KALDIAFLDCFGGPDAAHSSFTSLQKAINYVMTSYITTGGIRGKKKAVQRFEPRSFNMGLSQKAFLATGGFGKIHPGEDPDLSQRLLKQGFAIGFIEKAFVYHKRRISWSKFYTQVKKFGLVRPILTRWHPDSAKISFWFPSLFVIYTILSVVALFHGYWLFMCFLAFYMLLVFIDASIKNSSLKIGLFSMLALFIQFFGYGLAFAKSTFFIRILNENPQKRFPHLFFD